VPSPPKAITVLLALCGVLASMATRAGETPRFRESLWARETSLLVPEPPSRGDRLAARNWLILEDGLEAEVVRVEAAVDPDGEPWRTLVWVDRRLAGPGDAALARELLRASKQLLALGTVELAGGIEWPASREARHLQSFLEERLLRPSPDTGGDAAPRHAETAAALDALCLRLAQWGAVDSGVLVLPAAALWLPPAAWSALRSGETASLPDAGDREVVEALLDAARVAAAYGWIPFVLVPEESGSPGDSVGPGWRGAPLDPPGLYSAESHAPSAGRVSASLHRALDAVLDPSLQAWQRFAAFGGGGVARSGEALGDRVAALPSRLRLWYRTTLPPDGRAAEADVRWLPNGALVRAAVPRRRGTPEGVARARLRYLLRYGADRLGDLVLAPGFPEADSRTASVSVQLGPLPTAIDPPPPAWVRVSCLRVATAEMPAVWKSDLIERTRGAQSFGATVPCAGAGGIRVLIEDLESERWGSLALDPLR